MPRYFIYCRKSSEAEDRQVLSIESQTATMAELAAKLNVTVVEVLTEAKSAKAPGRPVFQQLMERLYRGEADGIICWKLDRLARNPVDGGSVIWAIKQHGIKVLTPAQSFSREEDNIILMYIEFGMAQKYVDDLSKNVKRGLKTKIEKGWYPGVAPAGYLNHKDPLTGEHTLIKDPERFPLIRKIWALMLTGLYSPPQILEKANHEWGFRTRSTRRMGGKPLARSGIYQILNKPFYHGRFEYPRGSGNWYEGKHDPMVTEAEFDRVQRLLGRDGCPRPQKHREFAFTGLIRCGGCDRMVTAEEKEQLRCPTCRLKFSCTQRTACPGCKTSMANMTAPKVQHYTYYHCTRRQKPKCMEKCVSVADLETQIDGYLGIKYLQELFEKDMAEGKAVLDVQEKAHNACERALANLVKLYTSPDNIDRSKLSDEEYAEQRAELLKEKHRLAALIHNADVIAEQAFRGSERILEFTCAVRERFVKGDPTTKRDILATVGSNLTLSGQILRIEARKPFSLIEECLQVGETENGPIEPVSGGSVKRQKLKSPYVNSSLLGHIDDVRTMQRIQTVAKRVYEYFRSQLVNPP
jgi:site-specific DNA recombinase